jgi:hypothetical protein
MKYNTSVVVVVDDDDVVDIVDVVVVVVDDVVVVVVVVADVKLIETFDFDNYFDTDKKVDYVHCLQIHTQYLLAYYYSS